MAYQLSNKARDDLLAIYLQGHELFGAAQAELYHKELEAIFGLLADNPKMARERLEITPPVRIHPYKAHLIVYLITENGDLLILRVRHAHEDWVDAPV